MFCLGHHLGDPFRPCAWTAFWPALVVSASMHPACDQFFLCDSSARSFTAPPAPAPPRAPIAQRRRAARVSLDHPAAHEPARSAADGTRLGPGARRRPIGGAQHKTPGERPTKSPRSPVAEPTAIVGSQSGCRQVAMSERGLESDPWCAETRSGMQLLERRTASGASCSEDVHSVRRTGVAGLVVSCPI